MKLWLLTQDEERGYDTFDSCVVAAPTEARAKAINPRGMIYDIWKSDGQNNFDFGGSWASNPSKVFAEYLGEAKEGTPMGVILSSFNAG